MFSRLPKLSGPRIVMLVTAVAAGYFLVTAGTTALQSSHLGDREDHLRAEISQLQQRHDRLKALEDYLRSEEYIEAVAREQLGLVQEGETNIVVIPTKPAPASDDEDADATDLWWETLIR